MTVRRDQTSPPLDSETPPGRRLARRALHRLNPTPYGSPSAPVLVGTATHVVIWSMVVLPIAY